MFSLSRVACTNCKSVLFSPLNFSLQLLLVVPLGVNSGFLASPNSRRPWRVEWGCPRDSSARSGWAAASGRPAARCRFRPRARWRVQQRWMAAAAACQRSGRSSAVLGGRAARALAARTASTLPRAWRACGGRALSHAELCAAGEGVAHERPGLRGCTGSGVAVRPWGKSPCSPPSIQWRGDPWTRAARRSR